MKPFTRPPSWAQGEHSPWRGSPLPAQAGLFSRRPTVRVLDHMIFIRALSAFIWCVHARFPPPSALHTPRALALRPPEPARVCACSHRAPSGQPRAVSLPFWLPALDGMDTCRPLSLLTGATRTHAYAHTRTRTSRGLPRLQGRERVAAQPGGPDSGGPTVSPALGPQPHCCHGDEYHTESSRGSDLSDIMEEDEEELCSETQLEDGGRRRPGGTSHNALKVSGPGHRLPPRGLGPPFPVPPPGPRPAVSIGFFLGAELMFRHSSGLLSQARPKSPGGGAPEHVSPLGVHDSVRGMEWDRKTAQGRRPARP